MCEHILSKAIKMCNDITLTLVQREYKSPFIFAFSPRKIRARESVYISKDV